MKAKSMLVLAALVLCFFYLAVLALLQHPAVSDEYRRYFITGESGLSPAQVGRLQALEMGGTLNFRSDRLGFDSWSNAENEYRWSLGKTPKLHFLVDSPQNAEALKGLALRFQPHGQQIVRIYVNDHLLYDEQADAQGPVIATLSLPPALIRQGHNIIRFELPNARMPGNGDPRVLGVALFELVLNPV